MTARVELRRRHRCLLRDEVDGTPLNEFLPAVEILFAFRVESKSNIFLFNIPSAFFFSTLTRKIDAGTQPINGITQRTQPSIPSHDKCGCAKRGHEREVSCTCAMMVEIVRALFAQSSACNAMRRKLTPVLSVFCTSRASAIADVPHASSSLHQNNTIEKFSFAKTCTTAKRKIVAHPPKPARSDALAAPSLPPELPDSVADSGNGMCVVQPL